MIITGKAQLEESLALRLDQKSGLEAKKASGEAVDEEELAKLAARCAEIQAQVGSAGVKVFRQLDQDGSGKLDRPELLRAIKVVYSACLNFPASL